MASKNTKKIHLAERINRNWKRELLTYPLRFEAGQCHPSSICLIGPNGPLACQLSDVVYDENGFAKSAMLSFLTDLSPLSEKTFTVEYSSSPGMKSRCPDTDLAVRNAGDMIEIVNDVTGVRVVGGEAHFSEPLSSTETPGPVMALRASDSSWFGSSALYGSRKVTGYRSEIEAAGPVFVKISVTYCMEDGDDIALRLTLVAETEAVFFESDSAKHHPDDGIFINLSDDYESPILSVIGEYERNKWGLEQDDIGHIDLLGESAGDIYWLVPWEDWFDGTTRTVFSLRSPNSDTVLSIGSIDPAAWNDVAWGRDEERHRFPFVPSSHWDLRLFKAMPLAKTSSGDIGLRCSAHLGRRKWFIGMVPKVDDPDRCYLNAVALHDSRWGCQTLNIVKDYVLDWQQEECSIHPCLYVSRKDVRDVRRHLGSVADIEGRFSRTYRNDENESYALRGRKLIQHMVDSAYLTVRHLMTLEQNFNKFDLMRHSILLTNMYDSLMGTDELSKADRSLLRAQIAFLGYRLDSPYVWDLERGFAGDPNNMHLSFNCSLGLVACVIHDHPMARRWAEKARWWIDKRLDQYVCDNGVWIIENMYYAEVSLSVVLPFAIAAQRVGFCDFLANKKLREWVLYIVKQLTPPNPQHGGFRTQPPDTVQDRDTRNAIAGVVAKVAAEFDPVLSRELQWAWIQQGCPIGISDNRFGGFDELIIDRSLPGSEAPDWRSESFPTASVMLRHGVGDPNEWYLALPICDRPFPDYYLPLPGGVSMFGLGQPLGKVTASSYGESYFTNGVSLARAVDNYDERARVRGYYGANRITEFSALPRQDYVIAEFHLDDPMSVRPPYDEQLLPLPYWPEPLNSVVAGGVLWQRQILFVKGSCADDVSYWLFRDTVTGSEPTMWTMWNLSEAILPTAVALDRDAVIADSPGQQLTSARQLDGDRFTAIGQFGVDVDFYVASPLETPRSTLRWGYDDSGQSEYQDLLHLQQNGSGAYYVALIPRLPDEASPEFETLGDGLVIRVRGSFGMDLSFLSAEDAKVDADNAHFVGTAASIQVRTNEQVLSLASAGEVHYESYGLICESAVSAVFTHGGICLTTLDEGIEPASVFICLPENLRPTSGNPDICVIGDGRCRYCLTIPLGSSPVELTLEPK